MGIVGWLVAPALAGPVGGATVGQVVPLQRDTDSPIGVSIGGELGYRAAIGPVHLRPDAIASFNTAAGTGALGLGGSATLGAPLAIGPRAHVGPGIGGGDRSWVADAGLLVEAEVSKLLLGLSAGWERSRSFALPPFDCSSSTADEPCEPPRRATSWLVVRLGVALAL